MKKTLAYATALLLAFGSTAYAQGGGSGGAVGGAAVGTGAGAGGTSGGSVDGSKSSTGPTGAQSDTSLPPAPNSITAGNRTGNNNSPLPGQPGNPQTGPIRR